MSAIDKQMCLYSRCRKIALKCPHIVSQIVAVKAGIVEHDDGACWRRFVIEDRKHVAARIALETIAILGPFFLGKDRWGTWHRCGRSEKKTVIADTSCSVRTPSL
jgi:hypothetical protein